MDAFFGTGGRTARVTRRGPSSSCRATASGRRRPRSGARPRPRGSTPRSSRRDRLVLLDPGRNALPPRTIDLLAEHNRGLLGAIIEAARRRGSGAAGSAQEPRTEIREPDPGASPTLRSGHLVRPCKSPREPDQLRAPRSRWIDRGAGARHRRLPQNTEGLYAGVEWTILRRR
jgi:hypothetical protein